MPIKVYFRLGRWDVLMEILDAQKQRISRFEIPKDMNLSSAIGDADTDILGKRVLMSRMDLWIILFFSYRIIHIHVTISFILQVPTP